MATRKRERRIDAARRGAIRYTGGECRKCGSSERYTSNGCCVACNHERSSQNRKEIQEAMAQAKDG